MDELILLLHMLTALLALPRKAYCASSRPERSTDPHEVWSSITPSWELEFHACYNVFLCARLQLPLDWTTTSQPRMAHDDVTIAVIKLPARVAPTNPAYGGPIVVNPGGPGGSGVRYVQLMGQEIQSTVDMSIDPETSTFVGDHVQRRSFDIVSFDPRGVMFSVPNALCFSSPTARQTWTSQKATLGLPNRDQCRLGDLWARSAALGLACQSRGNDSAFNIREYMSTSSVARDLLEIVEQLDFTGAAAKPGRPRELWSTPDSQTHMGLSQQQIHSRRPKLQYWGVSYGTFLGMTFASLYPDRVGKLVLDGVVNATDYVEQGWISNLKDSEKVLDAFYSRCFSAGPSRCALYAGEGAQAIRETVEDFINRCQMMPLWFLDPESRNPAVVTAGEIRWILFRALYSATYSFQRAAQIISDLKQHKFDSLLAFRRLREHDVCDLCRSSRSSSKDAHFHGLQYDGEFSEVGTAILCGDGAVQSNGTDLTDFVSYMTTLENLSPAIGGIWSRIRLSCMHWSPRPKWRYTGPFGWGSPRPGVAFPPTLWVSNSLDPVTPIDGAREMSQNFDGSVLLEQDSVGHGSFTAPSKCTRDAIGIYFQRGSLPAAGTVCPADRGPFEESGLADTGKRAVGNKEEELLNALEFYHTQGTGLFL